MLTIVSTNHLQDSENWVSYLYTVFNKYREGSIYEDVFSRRCDILVTYNSFLSFSIICKFPGFPNYPTFWFLAGCVVYWCFLLVWNGFLLSSGWSVCHLFLCSLTCSKLFCFRYICRLYHTNHNWLYELQSFYSTYLIYHVYLESSLLL